MDPKTTTSFFLFIFRKLTKTNSNSKPLSKRVTYENPKSYMGLRAKSGLNEN
jgi:hypothetical protein